MCAIGIRTKDTPASRRSGPVEGGDPILTNSDVFKLLSHLLVDMYNYWSEVVDNIRKAHRNWVTSVKSQSFNRR